MTGIRACFSYKPRLNRFFPVSNQLLRSWLKSARVDRGQSFVEFALILTLIAIVVLAILLIMGDDIRAWVVTVWQSFFPG
jgi:Flp pilus assembly pilin Flp